MSKRWVEDECMESINIIALGYISKNTCDDIIEVFKNFSRAAARKNEGKQDLVTYLMS